MRNAVPRGQHYWFALVRRNHRKCRWNTGSKPRIPADGQAIVGAGKLGAKRQRLCRGRSRTLKDLSPISLAMPGYRARRRTVNRRQALFSAAGAAAALAAPGALAARAPGRGVSKDAARRLQDSTLLVDGLDPSGLTEKYLGMIEAAGVDVWHQSLGGFD